VKCKPGLEYSLVQLSTAGSVDNVHDYTLTRNPHIWCVQFEYCYGRRSKQRI